jgi:myosin I
MTTIKFVVDPNVPRDDFYKSSTVHVPKGLPPNSESRPTPRGRSSAATYAYSKPRTTAVARPAQVAQQNGFARVVQEARVPVAQTARTQPPPPPPPPPPPMQPPAPTEPPQPIYRAMYDFQGQTGSEMSFSKGEVLEITKKEGNGKRCQLAVLISRMVARETEWSGRLGTSELS